MSHTIPITGSYGYTPFSISSGIDAGSTVDASTASWIVNNDQDGGQTNPYPFRMSHAGQGTHLIGGTINGEVSQTADLENIYYWPDGSHNNSVAVRVENSPGAIITDWRIDKAWDGIRPSRDSNNFLIEDVWITNTRDDAIENDHVLSGTIHDSLLEGNFVQISLGDGDIAAPNNVVSIEGVLMLSKEYWYKGEFNHNSPIKMYTETDDDVSPNLRFIDTVMAITSIDHNGYERLQQAWDKTIESRGNVFLNLDNEPLPASYPKPPAGWTILEGQAARDYWEKARAAWIDNHDSTPTSDPIPTPTPEPGPVPTPDLESVPADMPTFSGTSYSGSSGNDTIIGNDLANTILANSGEDVVNGGLGNDIIDTGNDADTVWGGTGSDVFVFSRGGDMDGGSKVDVYMDFEHGADRFDLKLIDANETTSDDQAFVFIGEVAFGSNKPGELRSIYDATKNLTRVELNTDTDANAEYFYHVDGRHSFAEADFIL
jgi:Ca2+-binding RTX toxin-like protein